MSIVLQGATSGSITLQEPAVAGTNTLNLPATTGTLMVNGPAFSAYANTAQTLSSGTFTKVVFQVEDFDTNNNFASSTFTPTVAGYYQVNAVNFAQAGTNVSRAITALYKNGSVIQRLTDIANGASNVCSAGGGQVVFMNGTTDYLEIYCWVTGVGTLQVSSTTMGESCRFSASLVRSA